MRFSRARYVTLCQQSLVTAAVLAVGVSAAGVKTLDIVPQPGQAADLGAGLPRAQPPKTLDEDRERPAKTQVDAAPVTPKVREVKVTDISAKAPKAAHTPPPNARQAPPKAQQQDGVDATGAPAKPKRVVALSEPEPVSGYATVGVTWKHGIDYSDDQIDVTVRTEEDGKWSSWMTAAYHDEHGPDAGSAEEDAGRERPGTDALVVGDVDRVQMRAETTDGSTPPDLKLALIDPGTGVMTREAPAIDTAKLDSPRATGESSAGGPQALSGPDTDSDADSDEQDTVALSAMKTAPRPKIFSRSQWGANERLREQGAPDYGTVKAGFIHHTVNSNSYSSSQVPSLLRGIYAYHTQSRGWRDIGYNYLVDRFGRIWEGRYGGVTRAVVGAHTLGYNEYSFALSAIGNYDIKSPPAAVTSAYARLFAWKLSIYNIRAANPRVFVKNRYFQAISGHRDAGQTACPGRYLYAKLPAIRTAAQRIQDSAQSTAPTSSPAPAPALNVFRTPTQKARAAVKQPTEMALPRALNLAGDANPDLVLRSRSGAVSVLPTGGQTGYRVSGSTPGNWSSMDLVAAAGDVTGDGRGDVLARRASDKTTRVYAGDGAGQFAVPGTFATGAFKNANLLAGIGDWNRDGRSDVLMREASTGYLWLVPGRGRGTFGPRVLLNKYGKNFSRLGAIGDVSGDGRPDLAGMHTNGYVYIARSTSVVRPSGFVKSRYLGDGYDEVVGADRDLSGDGVGDLVIRSKDTGALKILVGKRDGGFGRALGPFPSDAGYRSLSGGQVMGSAHPDLVAVNKAGTALVVMAHNGLVNLRPVLKGNLSRTDIGSVYNVGDWNGDGKGDVITRQASGDALVLRPGRGDGTFAAGSHLSQGGWKTFTYLAAVGDVTGDGDPDLIGRTRTGIATIFPGNGAKGFEAPILTPWDVRSFNQIGSGVWKTRLFLQSAYLSTGGSFVPSLASGAGDLESYDWVLGPGDLDGDGRSDLVARDAAGQLWLLPGTKTGHGPRRFLASGFGGYAAAG